MSTTEQGDPTHHLDAELIYEGQGPNAELEALGIRNVLEANGVNVFGSEVSPIPSLPVELRVPKDQVERAKAVLAEAEASGPEAAEAGELLGEDTLNDATPSGS